MNTTKNRTVDHHISPFAYVEPVRPRSLVLRTDLRTTRSNRRTPRELQYRRGISHGATLLRSTHEGGTSSRWIAIFPDGELKLRLCDVTAQCMDAAARRTEAISRPGVWKAVIAIDQGAVILTVTHSGDTRRTRRATLLLDPDLGRGLRRAISELTNEVLEAGEA